MSKAFTKDDAWEDPVVPPRAPLPAGVPNYVTPRGLQTAARGAAGLDAERQRLDADRSDESSGGAGWPSWPGALNDLAARIASAEVVDPARQPRDTVRFGAGSRCAP